VRTSAIIFDLEEYWNERSAAGVGVDEEGAV
jgi:hypothetical protein